MSRPARRSAARCAAVAVWAGAAFPATAAAQGAVSGVVVDSITGRPIAEATVQLVPAPGTPTGSGARGAATDVLGAFRLEGVPAGTYLLGFVHPRLDQLGIAPPVRQLTLTGVGPALRADLAVPSARTLAAAICGAAPGPSVGVLVGHVRLADDGRPVAGGVVTVQWEEIRVDAGGLRHQHRTLRAAADDEGRYALCSVPADGPVLARATPPQTTAPANLGVSLAAAPAGAASGLVEVAVPPRALAERDLLLPGRATARVAGRVLRPDGRPAAGARVLVDGDTPAATADATGRFAIDAVPAGSRTLEARAIGFAPQRLAVDLTGGGLATADLRFARPVATLGAVTVYGRATNNSVSGFLRRSRGGFGRFIFAEQIERSHANSVTDLLRTTPGLHVEPAGDGVHSVLYSRGTLNLNNRCRPDVYVNGFLVQGGAGALDDYVRAPEVAGIEVYTDFASAPVEYQRGPCGSVLVWTRGTL